MHKGRQAPASLLQSSGLAEGWRKSYKGCACSPILISFQKKANLQLLAELFNFRLTQNNFQNR